MGAGPSGADPLRQRIFLHIGAPKCGSTFLQSVLWKNRAALLQSGLHVPGASLGDHSRASLDIRGRQRSPDDPRPDWSGAWSRLIDVIGGSSSRTVVLTDEHLASLTDEQVARAVGSFPQREVHVLYAIRSLTRVLGSSWQEAVKLGATLPFDVWSRKILRGRRPSAVQFWNEHDAATVIDRWSALVEPARIHVLVLPPAATDPDQLWHQFADIVGVDPAVATDREVFANTSLGSAEVELLRRVNERLPADFAPWDRQQLGRNLVGNKLLAARNGPGRPSLPAEMARKVEVRQRAVIDAVVASGCHIVGDPEDLIDTRDHGSEELPTADEDAMLEAATAVTNELIERLAAVGETPDLPQRAHIGAELLEGRVADIAQLLGALAETGTGGTSGEGRLGRLARKPSVVRARTRLSGVADRSRVGARVADRLRTRLTDDR